MSSALTPRFTTRHLALGRALAAAIAAVMITFTSDHSVAVGLSVFSGFAIMTALVWGLSTWLVFPKGERVVPAFMGVISLIIGVIASASTLRTALTLMLTIAAWALITGAIELVSGLRKRAVDQPAARDAMTVGGLTVLLGIVMLVLPIGSEFAYYNREAHMNSTLTGITIMVGIFGAYAAILAVFEAIAGFSPQRPATLAPEASVPADDTDDAEAPLAASGKADND